LLDSLARERKIREKLKQPPSQTVFLKATLADMPDSGQQIIIQQDYTERKASWAMSDTSDAEYDKAGR